MNNNTLNIFDNVFEIFNNMKSKDEILKDLIILDYFIKDEKYYLKFLNRKIKEGFLYIINFSNKDLKSKFQEDIYFFNQYHFIN